MFGLTIGLTIGLTKLGKNRLVTMGIKLLQHHFGMKTGSNWGDNTLNWLVKRGIIHGNLF